VPQLNIYLDKHSEQAVWKAARRNSMSLSKWAREVLVRAANQDHSWPEGYEKLLGSISDETFRAPEDQEQDLDQPARFDI
jgi:hypothetical protein